MNIFCRMVSGKMDIDFFCRDPIPTKRRKGSRDFVISCSRDHDRLCWAWSGWLCRAGCRQDWRMDSFIRVLVGFAFGEGMRVNDGELRFYQQT